MGEGAQLGKRGSQHLQSCGRDRRRPETAAKSARPPGAVRCRPGPSAATSPGNSCRGGRAGTVAHLCNDGAPFPPYLGSWQTTTTHIPPLQPASPSQPGCPAGFSNPRPSPAQPIQQGEPSRTSSRSMNTCSGSVAVANTQRAPGGAASRSGRTCSANEKSSPAGRAGGGEGGRSSGGGHWAPPRELPRRAGSGTGVGPAQVAPRAPFAPPRNRPPSHASRPRLAAHMGTARGQAREQAAGWGLTEQHVHLVTHQGAAEVEGQAAVGQQLSQAAGGAHHHVHLGRGGEGQQGGEKWREWREAVGQQLAARGAG